MQCEIYNAKGTLAVITNVHQNRTTQEYLLFLASTRFNLSLLLIYTSASPGLLWG